MTADGLRLFFAVGYDAYEATRSNATQAFGSVVQRTELVTGSTPNEGWSDIWRAERSSRTSDFSGAEHFSNLNGDLWDEPVWVSDDDCELYLQRRDPGPPVDPVAGDGIFVARRPL